MKTATLALIIRDNEILLGEKKSGAEIGSGTLNGPGGKCEPGETPLECVVRETKEEVGIDLDPGALTEVAVVTFHAGGEPDFQVHVFRTTEFSGEPVETDELIPSWHSIDALPFDRMLSSDSMWFARAVSGDPFKANVYYKERASGFERIEFLEA